MSIKEYIFSKCDVINECWVCKIGETPSGYCRIKYHKKIFSIHRFAYSELVGDIPKGHHIHHICENKKCCNPEHLVSVTPLEHKALHKVEIRVCPNGHFYNENNTYLVKDKKHCRICVRERARVRRMILSGKMTKKLISYRDFFPKLIIESEYNVRLATKLAKHVYIQDGCNISTYSNKQEYDKTEFILEDGSKIYGSHVLSWILFRESLYEKGKQIHHFCNNIKCCNPAHLDRLSAKDHGKTRKRTHCKKGHEYTYSKPGTGWHQCSICDKERRLLSNVYKQREPI